MKQESYRVVLFHSMHAAFELEKALAGMEIKTKLIPTPRHLSSDCGTALRFSASCDERVRTAIAGLGIEIAEIHDLEG